MTAGGTRRRSLVRPARHGTARHGTARHEPACRAALHRITACRRLARYGGTPQLGPARHQPLPPPLLLLLAHCPTSPPHPALTATALPIKYQHTDQLVPINTPPTSATEGGEANGALDVEGEGEVARTMRKHQRGADGGVMVVASVQLGGMSPTRVACACSTRRLIATEVRRLLEEGLRLYIRVLVAALCFAYNTH